MTAAGSVVLAERYARALLDVVLDKKMDAKQVGAELTELAEFFAAQELLSEIVSSPTVASEKRVAIVNGVLAKQSLVTCTLNLLRLLAARERMTLLPLVSEQYVRLLLDHQGIQPGKVTSAHPLTAQQQERLSESLGGALGKTMELSYNTDAELLGGLVVRIGNRIYDASVTAQLKRFKEKALSTF